jgi:hypothetical protein
MRHKHQTILDAMTDRLHHSGNRLERRSLWAGRTFHQGFPVLLDADKLVEHMHIIGPPGTGKSTLALETLGRQLAARPDAPLVIFDGKGDIGLFNSIRHAAQMAGREFKWFTTRPFRSTYIFNPWDNRLLKRLTFTDILGLITQSLNLHHGQDYGRAWFSINARNLLRCALLETVPDAAKRDLVTPGGQARLFPKYGPIQSFRDLHAILRDLTNDTDEFKAAQHLALIVECLCDFPQLNLAPSQDPNHPALAHAIFMPEVIREKQVVYFYLAGALDNSAVAEIAKLGLFSLLMAAIDHHEQYGVRPRIYTIWDEAQIMIAKNIEQVLAQSRSSGMACLMAHQAMSQLNPPGGVDLRELFMDCTHTKEIFGVRDPWLLDYIARTSGTTRYFRRGYDLSPECALAGYVDPRYACPDREGQRRIRIQEFTGPRLSYQDILNVSRHPNLSLLWSDQPSSLCPFRGWFPKYTDWPVPRRLHEQYERQPWPESTEATIDVGSLWPEEDAHTITTTSDPAQIAGPEQADSAEALEAVWQDLHSGDDF